MGKEVFLLDKSRYWLPNFLLDADLTEKEKENLVADEDVIKIDANGYDSAEDAIMNEMPSVDIDDYYVFAFGF